MKNHATTNLRGYEIYFPVAKRRLTEKDFDSIIEEFAQNGFNVTRDALQHNYVAWLSDMKSGYRDDRNNYHLFSPCGCNPISFRVSALSDDYKNWQTTYEC